MTDRYWEYRQVAQRLGADAVALVPGSNFERLFSQGFHSHERPMLIVIPRDGAPSALVPDLEMRSFDALEFEGSVFVLNDWPDELSLRIFLAK